MNCPLCLSSRHTRYAEWPRFRVRECTDCGARFIDGDAGVADGAGHGAAAQIGAIHPDQPHIRRRVLDVLRFAPARGDSLDVGCGRGEVALALARRGFRAAATDMNGALLAQLRARFPEVQWIDGKAQDLGSLGKRFDVITMYHVLEHVRDPVGVLRTVAGLAKPGALIVVEVPNAGGLEARLKGARWHYYKDDHLTYFTPRHLRDLARKLGLDVLDVRGYQHFSYPQDVPWKDAIKGLLARVGFKDVVGIFMRVPP